MFGCCLDRSTQAFAACGFIKYEQITIILEKLQIAFSIALGARGQRLGDT